MEHERIPRAGWKACTARSRRGVGIIELLIALSISAGLLAAVALAVDASFRSYRANQDQTQIVQRARVATNYINTLIRTSDAHAPRSTSAKNSFAAGATVTDTGIDLYDPSDRLVNIFYDSANKRVRVTIAGSTNTLASNVESFTLKLEPLRSAASIRTGGGYDQLKRATITLTIGTGTGPTRQTVTLSSAVMPRRNVW